MALPTDVTGPPGGFPGVDRIQKLPADAKTAPVPKATISLAPGSLAEDPAMVARLVSVINGAYSSEVGVFWDAKWARASPDEVRQLVRGGAMAVAWLEGSTHAEPEDLVGCLYMKLADAKTGTFGMLACDPRCRGSGVGRDLMRHAETWAKRDGAEVMQLELLYPVGWESQIKDWLAQWYERAGYKFVREDPIEGLLAHMAPLLIQPTVLKIYHKTL